ncbi:hypothetical protein, partial [Flavobacterium reichenbachii]
MKNKIIILVLLVSSFLSAVNFKNYDLVSKFSSEFFEDKKEPAAAPKTTAESSSKKMVKAAKVFYADIKEGFIGIKDQSDTDDA